MLLDIHHVSINVSDTDRALEFYCDVLGMTQLDRPPVPVAGAWLDAGQGRQLHLIEADVPPDHGQHMAFHVADINEAIATLRRSGVEVSDAVDVPGTAIRQAFLHDPDRNRIELTQPA